MFALAGFFHGIQGLGAIFKKEVYNEAGLLYANLQFWGWVWLIFGVLQISAAYMIIGRSSGGRTLGIVVASASALVAFLSLGAYPVASITIIALNVLVIHGLTIRGDMFIAGGVEDTPTAPRPEPSGRPFA
jgi:hypothetical protein